MGSTRYSGLSLELMRGSSPAFRPLFFDKSSRPVYGHAVLGGGVRKEDRTPGRGGRFKEGGWGFEALPMR